MIDSTARLADGTLRAQRRSHGLVVNRYWASDRRPDPRFRSERAERCASGAQARAVGQSRASRGIRRKARGPGCSSPRLPEGGRGIAGTAFGREEFAALAKK
jgi:hypothetical protein